jgi:hypothetical protein
MHARYSNTRSILCTSRLVVVGRVSPMFVLGCGRSTGGRSVSLAQLRLLMGRTGLGPRWATWWVFKRFFRNVLQERDDDT